MPKLTASIQCLKVNEAPLSSLSPVTVSSDCSQIREPDRMSQKLPSQPTETEEHCCFKSLGVGVGVEAVIGN